MSGRLRRWGLVGAFLALTLVSPAAAQTGADDRAAIHALLVEYGRTLDARDFDGFAALFARDGTYVAGNNAGASGPEAEVMMRRVFAENAAGVREPNFHLFFNEVITLDAPDRAHATSMSMFMAPDEDGRPVAVMAARYADQFVREGGEWKFLRREVKALAAPGTPGD